MGSLFTNLVQKVVISRKWTENGPMLDREWTDEVAEKSVQMSAAWAMLWVNLVNLVNFAKLVMQIFKWTKWTKWTEQIFEESTESAKSARSIFATFATFASANFVGKASCESTVRYREWSRIPSCLFRYSLDSHLSRLCLASLICLCMLTVGVGNAWADYTVTFSTSSFAFASGGEYVSSSEKSANGWEATTYGFKYGASKNTGYTEFTMTSSGTDIGQIKASKITFKDVLVFSTDGSSLGYIITYVGGETTSGTVSAPASAADKDVELDNTKTIQKIKIYSTANKKRFYCKGFTVVAAAAATVNVTGVSVSPTSKAILVGETFTVTPTITPANATDKTVAWTTSASGKASVNSSGLVTGVAAGSATITCTTNDGSYTANTDVTVYSASVSIVDEDGTDISGSGVTATISGRTLTASEGSTKYKFKGWKYGTASGTSIASSSSLSTTLTGTPTGNVEVIAEFYKPVTVTWLVGSSSASGSPTTSVKRGSKITALPSTPADNAIGACANKFKGWSATSELIGTGNSAPADLFTSASDAGVVALTSPTTYRAVFATSYTTKVPTPGTYNSGDITSKIWSAAGAQTLNSKSWTLGVEGSSVHFGIDGTKGQQVGSSNNPATSMTLSSTAFSGTITSVKISTSGANSINASVGVRVGSTDFTKNGDGSTTSVSLTSTNTEYTFSGSATGTITISWANSSSKAIYFKTIVVGYTTMEDGTDYKDYVTECCTALGSINGSVSWSNPTEVVVSWDNLDHVSSWTVACKVHGGSAAGTIGSITTNGEGKKTCTITGLTCNTDYDFTITANPAIGYCEKEETLENKNSGKWNVAYSLTGVTKSSGPATGANVCGDYTAVFTPSNAAYALPSDVTVQIGGVTKTKDTDYTWDSSTGTLSIASNKITGDLSITVTGILVGCSADPTIGAASLSGAFGLSSVGVTVGTSSTGSAYCAWTDYGFVWGTSADPTVSDNKVQIGNSDAATTWSGNLTGSFSVGTTYYFRAYGTNSKTGAVPVYGTGNSFTPRSVTFDSNGGSAVAIVYVNSGSAVSEPSAPTRTGYDFVKWQLSGADYIFSSAVNANMTLVAVWSAKSYTVTLDQQSGSGGTGSVSATYNAAMPSATMPSRSGYDFGGYYGSEGGAGTQYYAADGSSAHPWDVANATTLYAKWTAKNYTITLNNEGADSGKEGTESLSVTFDANTNLTSAIMKPVRDGYQFGGYFTSTDGSGTQIIDENGNVIASVTSYTSATKQWIYANDIELHAYWKPSYTVTWSVNGETTTEQVVSGEQVAALPTDPTSSDCDDAKVFVGWRSTAIDGVSVSAPSGIFTTQAASPAITGNTTFYAVFADDNEETKHLTNSELETFYGTTTNRSYANGPFTITSSDGDWYGVCAAAYSTPSYYYVNIKSDNVTISAVSTRPYLRSPIYSSDINRITITHNSSTDRTLLICSSASVDPATDKIATISITNSNKSGVYADISSGVSQLYLYSSSGAIPIMSIDVNIGTPSNYVTSCSSCDADATFTNTTPVVSAIDCDAATLTATGGLATLGADGCNVSDYGFVIGTADNPAIGGSGVTKLQVGTTNPTTGADFSYDADGLSAGTHYYIRAYATNRHGTAYSGLQNFWTKGVSSIAITTAPTKTKYVEGETFDKTGMVVTATMADGSTEDVTSNCTFSPSLSTKLSDQTAVRATYSLCDVNKTADQAINVYTLTVTEGTNDTYGTAGKTDNKVTVTGLGDHKTYTVTVTSGNADKIDNGDGTYTITNATGNVTVRVDYADAVQVKVYYKVDGVTVTGLTQDVYQSETTTLPTASELATKMTAQGMEIPDDSYPNFVGWSETEFGAQTSEPTLVTGTPTINAEKTYYAVYTNLNVIRLDKTSTGVSTSNPAEGSADVSITVGGKGFKRNYLIYQNEAGGVNPYLQFKKNATYYGRIYNSDALTNILKVVVAYKNADSNVKVYACSAAGTISGDAITAGTRGATDPYVYTMPANTQYLMVRGDAGTTYKTYYIDIYYSPATVEYMTQFCTRYDITGVTKSGTAVTGGTLSSNYNSACEGKSVELEAVVNTGYQFNGWTIKKTADPTQDVTSTLLGANASSLTPPAFSMPAYAITVSASITEKELTGWTWKQELADASEITIPATVELYIGQQAKFNLKTYDPADVLAGKKGYSADYTGADLAQDSKAGAYYITRGKIAKESTTLTLTSTSNGSVQEVITFRIKELPLVHFVDNIHGETFADVVANVDASEKRTVYTTKPTPTHNAVDDPGASYNNCEQQHLHLIGWIESEWADAHPNAEPGDITGAGAGKYYAAGANIDLVAQNGKTFYAVWAKFE